MIKLLKSPAITGLFFYYSSADGLPLQLSKSFNKSLLKK